MHRRDSQTSKILNSKLIFIIALIILLAICFGLSKIIYRRLQIKKEVNSLDKKIETLKQSHTELTHLQDYLNTDSFREKSARKELGLKKPDENVIVITKGLSSLNSTSSNNSTTTNTKLSNPHKWWLYFFK